MCVCVCVCVCTSTDKHYISSASSSEHVRAPDVDVVTGVVVAPGVVGGRDVKVT